MRRAIVFVAGAGILAPFLSSFPDAAAVSALRGQPYWAVWWTRIFSNVLTELTVAPAIITVVGAYRDSTSHPLRRRTEAALLSGLLLVAAIIAFGAGNGVATAMSLRWPMAWLLPFMLWAAARFGPLGASW